MLYNYVQQDEKVLVIKNNLYAKIISVQKSLSYEFVVVQYDDGRLEDLAISQIRKIENES